MIRTNKTIACVVGVSALLTALGVAGCAAEQNAVPMKAVTQPKFVNFDPATYKGKTGTVTLPYAGDSVLILRKVAGGKLGDYLQVPGKSQSVKVPVGNYKLVYYSMTVADDSGAKWNVLGSPASEAKMLAMEVKPGGEIKLRNPEPFAASIKVTQAADKVNMSLEVIGSNGDKITVRPMDGSAAQPEFRVLSKSGEVLMSDKFAYG